MHAELFHVPNCRNTLFVVPSDPPDADDGRSLAPNLSTIGEPSFFRYCSFCRWDSAEVDITFEKPTGLAGEFVLRSYIKLPILIFGKSVSRRLAIKTLLELSISNPGKKGSKLSHQISAIKFVLESFGNARTLFNPSATRFGKYTELQYTERRRLSGIKTLDYYLERNRVAGAPSGERNFTYSTIFLLLWAAEERQHMQLLEKTTFQYFGHRGIPGGRQNIHDDDAQQFEQLKLALKNVGFSECHVASANSGHSPSRQPRVYH